MFCSRPFEWVVPIPFPSHVIKITTVSDPRHSAMVRS